jgi:hypothetical protein
VITLSATDADADPLTFAVTAPTGGGSLDTLTPTATCSAGNCTANVTYTPGGGIYQDSFTFTVNDGTVISPTANVTVLVFTDTDGDGIEDGIDTQASAVSNDFSEAGSHPAKPIPTAGTIDNRGDRIFRIADAPEPDGVDISVGSGSLLAQVTVNCTPQVVIQVQPGQIYDGTVTCGSATVKTVTGKANLSNIVDGKISVAANVAAGDKVKFDLSGGNLTLALSSTNPTVNTVFNDANTITMADSDVTVTYTVKTTQATISASVAGPAGKSAQVTIYGKTFTIPVGSTMDFSLLVVSVGDIDANGRVDGFDLGRMAMVFYSQSGDSDWNPNADLNGDGTIDGRDLTILGNYFGKKLY